MPGPIVAALDLAEDAILAALESAARARLGTVAPWGAGAEDSARRMLLPITDLAHMAQLFIAYHADNGGRPDDRLHSAGWAGAVGIRCLSADDDLARAGRDAAAVALATLPSPAGYALSARWQRPLPVLSRNGIHQRTGLYRVTIRRVPTP